MLQVIALFQSNRVQSKSCTNVIGVMTAFVITSSASICGSDENIISLTFFLSFFHLFLVFDYFTSTMLSSHPMIYLLVCLYVCVWGGRGGG